MPLDGVGEGTNICITALTEEDMEDLVVPGDCCQPIGVAHEFTPSNQIFNQPVTITLYYTDDKWDLNGNGIPDPGEMDENKFEMAYWNGEKWVAIGYTARDLIENWISVRVNHFTIYDIIENTCNPPKEISVCVYKNPFKKGEGTSFYVACPKKITSYSLRIFDVAGDLVYEYGDSSISKNNELIKWHGLNMDNEYLGSGGYIYQMNMTFEDGTSKTVTKPVVIVE